MGLDIGTDRVGVAISDESGIIAQPFTVIDAGGSSMETVDKVAGLVKTHKIDAIVLGLPASLKGDPCGDSAIMAKQTGEKIRKATGVRVIYWDERFTTAQAERALIEARVRRKERRRLVDKIAASLILQSYLDTQVRGD
jgi:putative Holliday junction resolvase